VTERQCTKIPGRRVCRQVPGEEVCRDIPGERICRNIPGEDICRDIPGERVCRQVPGEQICRTVPGERQCRDVPGEPVCHMQPGEPVCRNVPGDQICQTIPGRQECRTIPGQQVAYEDQECRDTTRRECRWMPPSQQCQQIPYEERVCRMETRYRQEPYACTRTVQVPYSVTLRNLKADLEFLFQSDAPDMKVEFAVALSKQGELTLNATPVGTREALIIADQNLQRQDDGRNLDIKGKYNVRFHDMAIFAPVSRPINEVKLKKEHLTFEIGEVKYPEILRIKLLLRNKKNVLVDKLLTQEDFQVVAAKNGSKIVVPLKRLGAKLSLLKKYDIGIDINVDFKGEILNHPRPAKSQSARLSKRRW
jgi:hypothetical protein